MDTIFQSTLFHTLVGLVGAWVVGNAIAARWQIIQKRKEIELQLAQSFYKYYGEFFAIWKIWHQLIEDAGIKENLVQMPEVNYFQTPEIPYEKCSELYDPDAKKKTVTRIMYVKDEIPEKFRNELHERAAAMEGGIEATLLKVASEIKLSDKDQHKLGQLRQAFSVIRYCIRHRLDVPFFSSEDEHYRELKRLSTALGVLLARPHTINPLKVLSKLPVPTAEEADKAWQMITHNKHEICWKDYLRLLREA